MSAVANPVADNSPGQYSAPRLAPARLEVLDATRGFAMLFVCLAHFAWSASQTLGASKAFAALITISMISSPTFLLVSGSTLGYVRTANPATYARFKSKLQERGVYLLTIVHWLMVPSFYYMTRAAHAGLRVLPITDTIGVCILIGPPLVERLTRRARIVTAAALLVFTWTVIYSVPSGLPETTRAFEEALFGTSASPWWFYSFPIVPWFAVYLFGTVLGENISLHARAQRQVLSWTFLKWACALVGAVVVIDVVAAAIVNGSPDKPRLDSVIGMLTNEFLKYPPSLAYILMYSATGLLMATITARLVEGKHLRWLTRRAGEIGRASLVVFVVQSYLYYFIELRWLPPRHFWPLYFLGSLLIVYGTSRLWLSVGGNALLKVPGWRRYVRPAIAPAAAA